MTSKVLAGAPKLSNLDNLRKFLGDKNLAVVSTRTGISYSILTRFSNYTQVTIKAEDFIKLQTYYDESRL